MFVGVVCVRGEPKGLHGMRACVEGRLQPCMWWEGVVRCLRREGEGRAAWRASQRAGCRASARQEGGAEDAQGAVRVQGGTHARPVQQVRARVGC